MTRTAQPADADRGAPAPVRRRRGARTFWAAFGVLFTLTAAWAVASPPAAGPDENAHLVKAAAVVRGQLDGRVSPGSPGAGVVVVPELYRMTMDYPVCFVFKPEQAADCAPALPDGERAEAPSEAVTWMVRNNPVYYGLVGWPTLLPADGSVLLLVRLVSALLCSAVLAWGVREAAGMSDRAGPLLGVAAATTPMVVFLNSTVNPSALEISAALTLWVSLLALLRAPDPDRFVPRVAAISVVTLLLVTSRGLSLPFAGLILLTVALVGPWRRLRDTVADRRAWPWLAVVAAGCAAAVAWTARAGTLEAGGAGHPDLAFLPTAYRTFMETGEWLLVSIGRFGWLDTDLPLLVLVVLVAAVAAPTLLGLAVGSRRDRVVVLVVVAVAVGVPVVLHAWQAPSVGYIWTARYSMPLFVGVPVVAGFVLRDGLRGPSAWVAGRLLGTVVPLLAVGHVVAVVVNLRRYTVGTSGSWRDLLSGGWQPVVPTLLLVLVAAAAAATGAVLCARAGRAPAGDEGRGPAGDRPPAERVALTS